MDTVYTVCHQGGALDKPAPGAFMKIRDLLKLDNGEAQVLPDNFGDAFLYKKNRIYKSIRDQTLKLKYKFDPKTSLNFQVYPFAELEKILQNKTIPYYQNKKVLENLVEKLGERIYWNEVAEGFKRNYLFHESCHAVARSVLPKANSEKQKCLQILLEESFANTCELISIIDANDEAHSTFLQANSYTHLPEVQTYINRAIKDFGFEFIFQYFLLGYLSSNYLRDELPENAFELLPKVSVDKSKLKNLKKLGELPFTLDYNFRVQTTGLHLKLQGFKASQKELLSVDFLRDALLISEALKSVTKTVTL